MPWGAAPAAAMAEVYRREQGRFTTRLQWDTTSTWPVIEEARLHGTVPGSVLLDGAGAVIGWSYYLARGDELQVGGFTASRAAVAPLLDAVIDEAEASGCRRIRLFTFADAPALADTLTACGAAVGAYHYLVTPLTPSAPGDPRVASWSAADLSAAADLLHVAYEVVDPLRPFGGAAIDAWIDYVVSLTATSGCGEFAPALTTVVRTPSARLEAMALVTTLSASMAHVAQLAVRPEARGRRLATAVLTAAMRQAAGGGATAMSLLVAADNDVARRLYAAHGFRHAASFLSAVGETAAMRAAFEAGRQPRRSTSAA